MNPKFNYMLKTRNDCIKYITSYTNAAYDDLKREDLNMKEFKQRFDSALEKIIKYKNITTYDKHKFEPDQ